MAGGAQDLWRFTGEHLSLGVGIMLQIKLSLVCLQRLLNGCLVLTSNYARCCLSFVCLMTSTTDG